MFHFEEREMRSQQEKILLRRFNNCQNNHVEYKYIQKKISVSDHIVGLRGCSVLRWRGGSFKFACHRPVHIIIPVLFVCLLSGENRSKNIKKTKPKWKMKTHDNKRKETNPPKTGQKERQSKRETTREKPKKNT